MSALTNQEVRARTSLPTLYIGYVLLCASHHRTAVLLSYCVERFRKLPQEAHRVEDGRLWFPATYHQIEWFLAMNSKAASRSFKRLEDAGILERRSFLVGGTRTLHVSVNMGFLHEALAQIEVPDRCST